MNLVLFGPPGAGKGTQGDNLVKNLNLIKASSGDLLRKEIKNQSSIGIEIKSIIEEGSLVPDHIINILIENILSDKNSSNRLILDGYPRNIKQAQNLDLLLRKYNQKISCVLNLKVNDEILIKRISGRQICSKCGAIFNKYFNKATENNHSCNYSFLKTRLDDNEKTIISRLKTYNKETFPIIEYYKQQKLLKEVDGSVKIHDLYKEIRQIIDSLETWLCETYLYK